MPEPPYTPIDCGFYDELLARATLRRPATVVYQSDAAEAVIKIVAEDVIEDVYSEGEAEYLRLRGGTVIRLDRLVSVDGKPLPRAC